MYVYHFDANPFCYTVVVVNKLGYTEVDKTEFRYKEEYREMRASFLMQYKPELLGELAEIPKLENHDEESLKYFFEQLEWKSNKECSKI